VRRPAQSLLVTLIGGTLLWISVFTRSYVNYVKPYFHPALIATGIILIALGGTTLARYWRARATGHGAPAGPSHCCPAPSTANTGTTPDTVDVDGGPGEHEHGGRGPRVAWLLALPVAAVFLLAPPALGSYAAGRDTTPNAPAAGTSAYAPLPVLDEPNDMYVGEFIGRSYLDGGRTLSNRKVRLLGFVTPRKTGGWYLTRIQISCCAADARAWKIHIRGAPELPTDSWVQVTGVWIPRKPGEDPTAPPMLAAEIIRKAYAPESPYEDLN
jgi:uncharacterized repeat protein (TIGR03943 family)